MAGGYRGGIALAWQHGYLGVNTFEGIRSELITMMNAAENKEALGTTETATAPAKAQATAGKHLIPDSSGGAAEWAFVSATSGSVAKQFQFKSSDGVNHKIVIKHHTVTGELDVLLDGKELLSQVTDLTVGNWSEQFYQEFPEFTVQGHSGVVKWTVTRGDWGPVPSSFGYACIVDGKAIKDDASTRASSEAISRRR